MRAHRWASGVAMLVCAACGEAGDDAAADDSAAAAPSPAPQEVAPPQDSAADTLAAPTREPDPQSSGSASQPASGSRPAPSAPIAGADTAVGEVSILGTAIDSRVVVQTTAGPIAVIGDLAQTIRDLQGMEVWIQGPLSLALGRAIPPRQITAQRFEVRSVAGVPVLDGTLREESGALVVVSADGDRTRLTSPPSGLRELVGRRVWVTRASDGAVAAFGEIR